MALLNHYGLFLFYKLVFFNQSQYTLGLCNFVYCGNNNAGLFIVFPFCSAISCMSVHGPCMSLLSIGWGKKAVTSTGPYSVSLFNSHLYVDNVCRPPGSKLSVGRFDWSEV